MTHAELRAAGFDIDRAAYQRLSRLVELLRRENRRLNLISARAAEQLWPAHICDSLALLPLLRAARPGRLLDLGAGAGLPGIPLACALPELPVTLLEARRKKLEAARRICQELGLSNVATAWGRAERLAHEPAYRERFEAVAARALARLPVLVEYASGFARPGGRCYFYKSLRAADRERREARSATQRCRLSYLGTTAYLLPAPQGRRVLLAYLKRAGLPAGLPRPPGQASRRPL